MVVTLCEALQKRFIDQVRNGSAGAAYSMLSVPLRFRMPNTAAALTQSSPLFK